MGIVLFLILAVLVFIFGRAILKANVRMQYADEKAATREMAENYLAGAKPAQPSWSGNKDKAEMFETSIFNLTQKNGIPAPYVAAMFAQDEVRDHLLSVAANMERDGSSFTQQQLGVYNLIAQMWEALAAVHKEEAFALAREAARR